MRDIPAKLPPIEDVRDVLERILASEGFVNSPRLQGFLTYIVEEELAGRGNAIKGKIIATDVYEKELDENGSALNLVRVEARRLRRGLEDYYSEAGRTDRVHISMQTGGYRPRFELVTSVEPIMDRKETRLFDRTDLPPRRIALFVGSAALLLALGVGYFGLRNSPTDARLNALTDFAKLSALRERSISSVQAVNLAEQARAMFFPLFDTRRQANTLEIFRHIIDLDPGLPVGYAGAAQVLALQSMLTSDADAASALLTEATVMAERATTLDPTDGWSQAAHGWTLAVVGDEAGALRRARIAVELEPQDGHILDLIGITALLANDPSLMAEVSDPERPRTGDGRFAYNNIWGASQLIMRNYDEVIEAFSTAAERGHPVSAPSLLLLATAHRENGNTSAARQAISEMWDTWPGFPAREVAARFFANEPMTRSRVLSMLDAYPRD
jgi:hypothetical protein